MSFYLEEELQDKVDRFALNLVKEYRRYVGGEGYANEETSRLFGCSVFAHHLAKCNHTQKLLKEKGIPADPAQCYKQRHHFFLCTGAVYCQDLADNLIMCVKKANVSSATEMKEQCPAQYSAFLDCYTKQLNLDYPDKVQKPPQETSKE